MCNVYSAYYELHISRQSRILLLLFWHAPLGVRSAICRHQPPQRAVLSQVDCFIQCKVVGSQVSLDGVQPRYKDTLVVYSSSLEGKPSGMAHVNEGSHSFTCHPHVHPQIG